MRQIVLSNLLLGTPREQRLDNFQSLELGSSRTGIQIQCAFYRQLTFLLRSNLATFSQVLTELLRSLNRS